MKSLLSELTPEQHEAVTHGGGPCLVIAGAGTGKTKVITHRIAYLITEKNVDPESILALTFTDKAAEEMLERVDVLVPYGKFGSTISTFHSFCNELVRRHGFVIGTDPGANQIGPAEAVSLLRANIDQLPIKEHQLPGNPAPFLRQLVSYIDRATEEGIEPDTITAFAESKLKNTDDEAERETARKQIELAACYRVAKHIYREQNVLTYADLISQCLAILRTSALALKQERERFSYILVDEFQDTNTSQAEIVYLLAGEKANVMVVGDDDQAIYRFRGANIQNILTFKERYPKAQIITLRDNFRSSQPILDACYRLIQHNNPNRLEVRENIDKRLISHTPHKEPVAYSLYAHNVYENEAIAQTIQDLLVNQGYDFQDIAVLTRAHNQSVGVEEALNRLNIPVIKHRDTGFYERPVIQQALAYLRFLHNPDNNANTLYLLINPPFTVPLSLIRLVGKDARYHNNSLWEQFLLTDSEKVGEQGERALNILQKHLANPPTAPSNAFVIYLKDTGIQSNLEQSEYSEDSALYYTFIQEIRSFEAIHKPATLERYITHIDDLLATEEEVRTVNELETEREGIQVMTIHKSKGLEFRAVFVPQLAMQRFPSTRGDSRLSVPVELLHVPEDTVKYEEERRLAYVAFTRAKERLFLSRSIRYDDNKTDKKVSPFVIEALGLTSEPDVTTPITSTIVPPVTEKDEKSKSRYPSMPKRLSASALETFETCPKQFEYEYVYHISQPANGNINFGISIHKTLQTYFASRVAGTNEKLEDIYEKSWVKGGYLTKSKEKEMFEKGLLSLSRYLGTLPVGYVPDRMEVPVELALKDGTRITGRIDRIDRDEDGTIHIVDYKTGESEVDEKKVKKNLPLNLYAAALVAKGESVGSISLHYVITDTKATLPIASLDLSATIKKAEEIVARITEAYGEEAFDTTSNPQDCTYCIYKNNCPKSH